MQQYKEYAKKAQERIKNLPIKYAFSDKQFVQVMEEFGLNPDTDKDKIIRINGGGIIKKVDLPKVKEAVRLNRKDFDKEIAADTTGEGFIFQMFYTELNGHEYNYTCDPTETLDALGMSAQMIAQNPALRKGFNLASQKILGKGAPVIRAKAV